MFDYPLSAEELEKWDFSTKTSKRTRLVEKNGLFCLEGREEIVEKRLRREKYSRKKLQIARRGARLIGKIPSVKMVGITGALAMRNAEQDSDIDLMVVASEGSMWTTRLIVFFLLRLAGYEMRRAGKREKSNSLCINIFMDESDLRIAQQSAFGGHEIAQIIPIVNKEKTYERLIVENLWIKRYWPNAIEFSKFKTGKQEANSNVLADLIKTAESLTYATQKWYMKGKISRETVIPTRAFFHPRDWGKRVEKELEKRGVCINVGAV